MVCPAMTDHQTVTLNLPGSLAPGTDDIGGIADYTNVIAEGNEANNNHDVTKIIVTAPRSPILELHLISSAARRSRRAAARRSTTGIVNFGKASASASTTGIYLSTDATITTSDTLLTTVGSAGAGGQRCSGYFDHQTVTLTMSAAWRPAPTISVASPTTPMPSPKSNETNNNHEVTKITVTAPAQPDLCSCVRSREQHDDRSGRKHVRSTTGSSISARRRRRHRPRGFICRRMPRSPPRTRC